MSSAIYGVISAFCGFIQFVIYVTFFIIAVTVVRSRRPDAWAPLGAGAGLLGLDFVIRYIASMLLPVAMMRLGTSVGSSGIDSFYGAQSMVNVAGTLLGGFAWALVLIGIVRIASPPREPNLNRAPGDY